MSKKRKTPTDPLYELPVEGDLFVYEIQDGFGTIHYILPTTVFPSKELLQYALKKIILSPDDVKEEGDIEDQAITALTDAEHETEAKGLGLPAMENADFVKHRARLIGLIGVQYC
jgi:hypothetical protein